MNAINIIIVRFNVRVEEKNSTSTNKQSLRGKHRKNVCTKRI